MNTKGLMLAGGLVFVAAWMFDKSIPKITPIEGPFAKAELTTNTYLVSGGSIQAVRRNLNRKGPKGHWGITRWHWKIDDACNVEFYAKITVPKLSSRWRLSTKELAAWDQMNAALLDHEMSHVEIARQAAIAAIEADCDPEQLRLIQKQERRQQVRFDLGARTPGGPGYVSLRIPD